jgi:hypothetical protein
MLSMPRIVRPDLFRLRGIEIGFPAESATRQSIKRNKELAELLTGKQCSQIGGERGCERGRVRGKPKREPRYPYRIGSLLCWRVIGRTVCRVRSEKILGRAEMALLLSAFVGMVHNRRCLLRGCICLRLPGSSTPGDAAISKRGVDAAAIDRGFKRLLECAVFSGKRPLGHFRIFAVLFSYRNRVLVLLEPVR